MSSVPAGPPAPSTPPRALVAWVLLRLPVPLLVVLALPALSERALPLVDYGHSAAKLFVGVWVTVLYRQRVLPVALALALAAALVLPRRPGRAWTLAAALAGALLVALPADAWLPGKLAAVGLLLVNLAPGLAPGWARAAWLPLTELLFPGPIARVLGAPVRLARVLAAGWLATSWFVVDAAATMARHADAVWAWPDDRLDPRVRVLDRAGPGLSSEFHGIDVAGARVTVVAESSLRLLGFPRSLAGPPAVQPLHPWWGVEKGLTVDSASDPATGTTWFLDGPDRVAAVRWVGDRALRVGTSVPLPRPLDHAYTRWIPSRSQLFLVTVNVVEERLPPGVLVVDTPALNHAEFHVFRTPAGDRLPHLRDIEWIPSLGRLVLAPDFGTRLWLADPDTGLAEPWLDVATMNGRMLYEPVSDRLFLAMPNRFSVLVVDPHTGTVERRIPTQPGVRPLAVDADRGLLVTASLATGAVWVQRLADGAVVDSFRTVMPMVRELALLPEEGVAVLTTWTRVYTIPYGGSAKR